MLLSIIVPVYNVEKYLRRCVDSLLDQGDFDDYEIILIDDGSTDSSGIICDTYSEIIKNITIIHKENGGQSSARNRGIKCAIGRYTLFVDSDDYIRTNCLSDLLCLAVTKDADVVCYNFNYVNEKYDMWYDENTVNIGDEVLTGRDYLLRWKDYRTIPMGVCSKLYKTSLIMHNKPLFREGFVYEDEEWVPRILYAAERIVQYDGAIYGYFMRESSTTHSAGFRKPSIDLIENCKVMRTYCKSVNDVQLRQLLENNIITLSLSAFYRGRLFDKCDDIKGLIRDAYAEKGNSFKRILFLVSPKIYYKTNQTAKCFASINGKLKEIISIFKKIRQYGTQEFHRNLRKHIVCKKQIKELRNHSFSIISSTSIGGMMTSELGEQLRSPTINLWISAPDFLKMIKNLRYYMNLQLIEKENRFEPYPVGLLDDITIYFLHYHSFEEAKGKWELRKKRINWDNLFLIMVENDGCTPGMVWEFNALSYEHKMIFTKNEYPDCKSAIRVTDLSDASDIGIMTDFVGLYSRRYDACFDYVGWLNGDNQDGRKQSVCNYSCL